ncbi:uncharacterized protein ATC70_011939 [Mucor velutinosus]|uniref:DIS3-like exonuclease 2 n=1 Tax=Mucor velutinosus TaxID=708070 RepID=A0AAN7DR73_9FUNG|nr:hypothetical protein ATC70_011939 [Mucor velutinosus]
MDGHTNTHAISKADDSDNWRRRPVDQEESLQQRPTLRTQNWKRHNNNNRPKIHMDDIVPKPRRRRPKAKHAETKMENSPDATPVVTKADQQQPPAPEITLNLVDFSVTKNEENAWNHYARHQEDDSNDEDWVIGAPVDEIKEPKANKRTAPPYIHPWDRNSHNKRTFFLPFWNPLDIERGIEQGTLYQGIMCLTKNPIDAYVKSDDLDFDIYIGGAHDKNRAMDGDLVAVQLVDVEEVWELRKERRRKRKEMHLQRQKAKRDQEEQQDQKVPEQFEDPIEEEETVVADAGAEDSDGEDHKPVYCGHVVGILERAPHATYTGTILSEEPGVLDELKSNAKERQQNGLAIAWFKPTDRRVPIFKLRGRDIPRELGANEEYFKTHLFSVSLLRWQITDRRPSGKFEREIGPIGDLFTERQASITNNCIIDTGFTPVALGCLPPIPWAIPEKEYALRRDLRNERVFSIDPPTAKDLDDALHIKELEDGFFEVGVHIADVSYFLKRNTALDAEARARGTSTYLVDSVIPMLPSLLCEELCSLNPGVERLAFSVIWKMNEQGKPVDTWFGKTIIKSCAKLAYDDAQQVIEGDILPVDVDIFGNHDDYAISNDILMLHNLSVQMRQQRYDGGSLSMNSVKLQFMLDDKGEPISFSQFEAKAANRLIEEFMLLANISVAHKIAKSFPDEALLRRHEYPLSKRLNEFIKVTEVLGLNFDGHSAGSLQSSFDSVNNQDVKDVLLILAIRTMQRAKYFCSGSLDIAKFHHYALNEAFYTHFTSPIRRYADVIVHRILETALANDNNHKAMPCPYNKKMLQKIAFECNTKKDGAKNAQNSDIMIYLCRYLTMVEKLNGPVYTKADVITTSKETYEVCVPEYGLEKRIHLKDLPVSRFDFDKTKLSLNIFWKRGVPVTMRNEEKMYAERVTKDDYSSEDDDDEVDESGDPLDSLARMTLQEPNPDKVVDAGALIPSVILDEETCMQTISMFSQIDVRLQINNLVSPPMINIYPVNPFSGEEEELKQDEKN